MSPRRRHACAGEDDGFSIDCRYLLRHAGAQRRAWQTRDARRMRAGTRAAARSIAGEALRCYDEAARVDASSMRHVQRKVCDDMPLPLIDYRYVIFGAIATPCLMSFH